MKLVATLGILFILAVNLGAHAQVKISGRVISNRKTLISGAQVSLKNSYDGTSTDSVGNFAFSTTEKGPQWLVFSAIGFGNDSLQIDLDETPHIYELVLKNQVQELNVVTVSAGSFEASDTKKGVFLNSLDIATTAGSEADVFAALQTLPGTQVSFGENGLFVRGGLATETQTFFDGLLVKNPQGSQLPDMAARGRFSPFLFKGTNFSAGGYSAVYGQALSSALILESKDLPEKTTTAISLMTVGIGANQNQRFKNSSLSIGGNYYNLKPAFTVFKQNTNWVNEPVSADATVQYKVKTTKNGTLKFYGSYADAKVGLFTANNNNPEKADFFSNHNKNIYSNLSYSDYLSKNLKLQSGFSYSNTADNGLMDVNNYTRKDELTQGKTTLTYFFGTRNTIKFGGDWLQTKREESWNGLSRDFTDNLFAAYAEADIFFTSWLVARAGLRAENSLLINKSNLAPRLSLSAKTGEFSQVSAAYGKFYQQADESYLVQTTNLNFENAAHYLLNYQRNKDGQTFRAEIFYKKYASLVKNLPVLNQAGDGYAQGLDIFWRDKKSIKNVDYWLSYSYLDTKRNAGNYQVALTPVFAAKHTANVVYKQYVSAIKSQISGTYTFASGRPYYNPADKNFTENRTKSFQNLSLSVSYLTRWFNQFTVIYASCNNIAGFKNVYGYRFSDDGSTQTPIIPQARRNFFLGVFLTIGDNTLNN